MDVPPPWYQLSNQGCSGTPRRCAGGDQACRELALVVRSGRARSLAPDTVAAGLGLALLGSVADDPGLILAAESGDPPARSSRSPLARTCRLILDPLLAEQSAA